MLEIIVFVLASVAIYPLFRQDTTMNSLDRYRRIDLLNLQEVEQEIETMISIIGENDVDTKTMEYVMGLMQVARALGTTKKW